MENSLTCIADAVYRIYSDSNLFYSGGNCYTLEQQRGAERLCVEVSCALSSGLVMFWTLTEMIKRLSSIIKDHTLVQVEGTYAKKQADNTVDYSEIVFIFYQYVDEKAEGGRLSAVEAEVNMTDNILNIRCFYGAGKAYSSLAGTEEIKTDKLDVITDSIQNSPDMKDSGSFTSRIGTDGELVVY